jgi:hypothetical protein
MGSESVRALLNLEPLMKQSVLIAALLTTVASASFAQAPATTKPAASASAPADSASVPKHGKKDTKAEKHHGKKADAPAHAASAASAAK